MPSSCLSAPRAASSQAAPGGRQPRRGFNAGKAAYINFVSSLLSITDNLDGDKVLPPKGIVRRDKDDPYFVVAADKGTATFSDTANAISEKHHFWLDDAFASGGSAGYDHKKMGITAKGAWEAVKRHFREMNRDIQTSPFTSSASATCRATCSATACALERTRLIAAFDHRDIFIDPDPDEAVSFAERKRMFDLPRSSWADYDKTKLSKGGAIISRAQNRSRCLPKPPGHRTGQDDRLAKRDHERHPEGGCRFALVRRHRHHVKASTETNQEVGDRANDAIRVTARDLRAKVIGEGANLGVTQRARIEFGLLGGRCNSDAIDNSGGVNSSDVEVNIKIALANAMRRGALVRPARNKLLAEMTDEVGRLVLANNYGQTLAISLAHRRGLADMGHEARFMTILEGRGLLDRAVENLPSPAQLPIAPRVASRSPAPSSACCWPMPRSCCSRNSRVGRA
jgi:glutamate dehydrogenase